MAKVVRNSSQLDPQDRAAIATYIKSLPPVEGPVPPPKKTE
jgi:mono/diheme cytochrome c family protein